MAGRPVGGGGEGGGAGRGGRFTEQLEADCALLESLRVMDYSLLLGVHSRSGGFLAASMPLADKVPRLPCRGALPPPLPSPALLQ